MDLFATEDTESECRHSGAGRNSAWRLPRALDWQLVTPLCGV